MRSCAGCVSAPSHLINHWTTSGPSLAGVKDPEPGSPPIGMVADYQAEPIEADHDDSMYDI